MIEEFMPVPQVGHRYVTNDKRLLTVTSVADTDGVTLVHASDFENKRYELNAAQWNELDVSDIIIIYQENEKPFSEQDIKSGYQKNLDGINQRRSQGKALKWKCGVINEFLWMCAGVDRDLLRTCKSDWASKAGIGSSIFMTALLTAMSVGFAIHLMTDYLLLVVAIGVLFGLLVFTLDRFVINTIYSDGKSFISWKEFLSGLPRIIVSIFLGLIIAIPIEIQVFRGMINEYLCDESQKTILLSPNVISLDNHLKANRFEMAELDSCIRLYEKEYREETCLSDVPGVGAVTRSIEKKIITSKARKEYLNNVSDSIIQAKEILIRQASLSGEHSLSQNIQALYVVTGHDKMLFIIRMFISLFFIIIEMIPILSKMMMTNRVYDELLEQEQSCIEKLLRMETYIQYRN